MPQHSFVWIITHTGSLVQGVGCKIKDPDRGMYGQCYLVLLTKDGNEYFLRSDRYWSGKTGPEKFLTRAQEIIVKGITESKTGRFDFRENEELMGLLVK